MNDNFIFFDKAFVFLVVGQIASFTAADVEKNVLDSLSKSELHQGIVFLAGVELVSRFDNRFKFYQL